MAALGTGIGAGQADTYVIEQAGDCTELTPLSSGDQSVEAFYGYTTDATTSAVPYSANTPVGIEYVNDDASSLFLYQGPEELALVLLHDGANGTGGGAATLEFVGLPESGEWVVKDDPENESVEQWNRTTPDGRAVDWGWRGAYTDGGAFAGGLNDEFEIRIDPAFNEDAEIAPVTPGNVTTWRAFSQEDGSIQAVELDLDEPVTVRTGTCS